MKRIIALFGMFVLLLAGCGSMGKTQNPEPDAAVDESQIPSIVFMSRTDSSDVISKEDMQNGAVPYLLTFYDKDGNYYACQDTDVFFMDYAALVSEYEAGNLESKLVYHRSCSKNELLQQAGLLQRAYDDGALDHAQLEEPEEFPSVEAESRSWIGFYYDTDGNLQSQTLHSEKCLTHLYMNDDTLNQIYNWIIASFHEQTAASSQPDNRTS